MTVYGGILLITRSPDNVSSDNEHRGNEQNEVLFPTAITFCHEVISSDNKVWKTSLLAVQPRCQVFWQRFSRYLMRDLDDKVWRAGSPSNMYREYPSVQQGCVIQQTGSIVCNIHWAMDWGLRRVVRMKFLFSVCIKILVLNLGTKVKLLS